MSKNNIIVATLSPQIEYDIIYNCNLKNYYDYFSELFQFADKYYHIVHIVIPNEVLESFYSDRMFMNFLEELENVDSGISRLTYNFNDCQICFETPTDIYPEGKTVQIISNQFYKNRFPILFDLDEILYKKTECKFSNENCNDKFCKDLIQIKTTIINNYVVLDNEIKICCKNNIEAWKQLFVKQNFAITTDELKTLCIFYAFIFNATKKQMLKLQNTTILDEILSTDIRKTDLEEMKHISTSIARAILFPSVNDNNHDEYSIDWHINDKCPKLPKESDYTFYKADVVPENRTGNGGKIGTNRILLVEHKGVMSVIGFTRNHYFYEKFCEERLNILKHKSITK